MDIKVLFCNFQSVSCTFLHPFLIYEMQMQETLVALSSILVWQCCTVYTTKTPFVYIITNCESTSKRLRSVLTEQDGHVRYRRTILLFHEVVTISPLLIAEQIHTDIWLLHLTGKEM